MSDDVFIEYSNERSGPPRDRKIDEAKAALLARYFLAGNQTVYYGRQLEVALEDDFFHWITKKALNELAAEGKINHSEERTELYEAHFYWPLRHRYARRQIRENLALIAEFSRPEFTRALGHCGEALADAGFARIGFRIRQAKVREVDGKRWDKTNQLASARLAFGKAFSAVVARKSVKCRVGQRMILIFEPPVYERRRRDPKRTSVGSNCSNTRANPLRPPCSRSVQIGSRYS